MTAPLHGTTCLVVQWLKIYLVVQGTQVPSLAGELRSHMPRGNWVCVPQLLSLQGLHQNNPRDTMKIPMKGSRHDLTTVCKRCHTGD